MAYTIKILSHDKTVRAKKGDVLADKILESGIELSLYCQKRAVCGKCMVEIKEGYLPPPDGREAYLIGQKKGGENYRLACKYLVKGNVSINVPPDSLLQKTLILKTGLRLPLTIDPPVKKFYVELPRPDLAHPRSLISILKKSLGKRSLRLPVDLLRQLPDILEKSSFKVTTVLHDDNEILAVEPEDTTGQNYGLAADIGTTTLVLELVDLTSGESIDSVTENNSQMKYGMDIVSRISFSYHNPGNLAKLQDSILKTLCRMIDRILKKNGILPDRVYEIAFAGNTAMNHLLLGVPVDTLAVSPFHAAFHSLPVAAAGELGFRLNPKAKAYIAPNIKSFVGGDISSGLQAVGLANRPGNHLFIDLGTNGEIVLKTEKKFVATSTAAGPAFEGMNICSGMLALPGAIYKAEKKGRLVLHTIGRKNPRGICGTGLIDLIALFLKEGKISATGKINHEGGKIPVSGTISVTQKDVREIQLAIAAVRTGIRMILENYRIEKESLDSVFIAGAFGNYLNIKNAMRIGLLPQIDPKKIVFIGNSSLAGARALLLSRQARSRTEALIKKVHYVSLATDAKFQDIFVDSLHFPAGIGSK
jgi:uncharacterized 2Fe-2S/4Fe-4S cluster protein (DUF4445 family)